MYVMILKKVFKRMKIFSFLLSTSYQLLLEKNKMKLTKKLILLPCLILNHRNSLDRKPIKIRTVGRIKT